MKVNRLIELLRDQDQEAEVHIVYVAADYWRTAVAPPVASVDVELVKRSEYHQMDAVVMADSDDDEDADGVREVVVLNS